VAATLAALLAPAPAAAATHCVHVERPECVDARTVAETFEAAADGDRILLGEVTSTAALDDGGRELDVVGSGERIAVRDLGAFELQPPARPLPAGNLLADPGAEQGGAWTLAGGFARERYGSFNFPSRATGDALGAGDRFFAGGSADGGSAAQHADLTWLAPEIDRGTATASPSALLGGYRADTDPGIVPGEVPRSGRPAARCRGPADADARGAGPGDDAAAAGADRSHPAAHALGRRDAERRP